MYRFVLAPCAFALALVVCPSAKAAGDADLAEIREQIRQLKESYEARIRALEERLQQAETKAAPATPAPEAAPAPTATAGASSAPAAGIAAFNPAISAVLQGVYANMSEDPNRYAIAGFAPSGDIVPAKRGFSIAESELTLTANVDDKFYGNLTFSLSPENTVEVEEAYGLYTAAPVWPGAEVRPLPVRHRVPERSAPARVGFLRRAARLSGIPRRPVPEQRSAGEMGRADGSLHRARRRGRQRRILPGHRPQQERHRQRQRLRASGRRRRNKQQLACRTVLFADRGTRPRRGRQADLAGNDANLAFTGRSQIAIADFVWKWAPNGNAQDTNFKLQGEYFWRREHGDLNFAATDAAGFMQTGIYRSDQSGFYAQGVWQFMPTWRVGARYDWLNPGSVDYGANGLYLANGSFNPQRAAVMLDWTPSEFSRFRVQFQQAKLKPDFTDNEIFVQYILTLGAHGAHKF